MENKRKQINVPMLIIGVLALIALCAAVELFCMERDTGRHAYISAAAADDVSGGWIEISNSGPRSVSLKGWTLLCLTENEDEYSFSNIRLRAGDTLRLTEAELPFSVPSGGGTLTLMNARGQAADEAELPPLGANEILRITSDGAQTVSSGIQ